MPRQDDYVRTALRLPRDMHKKLHAAALQNGRGFNAEILERLAASFVRDSVEERLSALERAVKKGHK
jgi:Arc/MetJ-type ribon-helix-helix transcriptional regulator